MTLNQELLLELIPLVGEKIEAARAEIGEFELKNYKEWRQRSREADARLCAFFRDRYDARFIERPPHDHRVLMAGIRSTSTSGWNGALQNWKRAAEARVAEARYVTDRGDGLNPHGSGPIPIERREG